jgi:flagellar biogenesis protein FliO
MEQVIASETRSWMGTLLERLFTQVKSLGRTVSARRQGRALQLCETLQLGEKRFLALVRADHERLLVGVTGNSIALLTRLSSESHPSDPEVD